MSEQRWMDRSEGWMRTLLRLYPTDFREDMGESLVETYRDRCRAAYQSGGATSLAAVWMRALLDSIVNGTAERVRPAIRWRRAGNWGRDAELAMRRLIRAPTFVLAMVGTLTIGLGAFAVVYTVVHKVLLAPMPYERPDDLYFVWRNYTWIDLDRGWLGGPDVAALDSAGGVIEGAVGLRRGMFTLSGDAGGEPSEVPVMVTSPGLFEILGVGPALGRGFAANEFGPGRPPVVVLGDDLWRRQFGADHAIIGSEIRLNGTQYTVIGIMGPGFRFARHASLGRAELADAYITFDIDLASESPFSGGFAGLIRAAPGTAPERVAEAVGAVGRMLDERDMNNRGLKLYPTGLKADLVSEVRPALIVLGLAGGFLVLVLTVNLATLLLARAAQREREFAISRALGADQLALVRATVLEGGLLGMLGGAGGALFALWGTRALVAMAPMNLPRRDSIAVDWQIAALVVGVGAVLGILAGAVPAGWATRTNLATLMSSANVRGGGGGHGGMRRALVVVQVALSLVLLSAGGLVVRSFEGLLEARGGFNPSGVLTLRVPVSGERYDDSTTLVSLHERLQAQFASLPGVTAVGAASALPLSAGADQAPAAFPTSRANTGDEDKDEPLVDIIRVRPGLTDALGIPVLSGRLFQPGARPLVSEAVIDRTLAAQFFPAGDAVGAPMMVGSDTFTVIGVVEHARLYDIHEDGRAQVYLNNADSESTLSWALRTDRTPTSLTAEVRRAVRSVDPELAIADVRSMDQIVAESLRQQRVSAVLISGFALGALLLTSMGLFGVVSGSVTRRRHELAIRIALGADHRSVLRLVLREGALLVGLGLALGAPLIYFSGQALRGILIGVSPFDPVTLAAVAAGLALVAVAACYLPARRVTRIDPARSLGSD